MNENGLSTIFNTKKSDSLFQLNSQICLDESTCFDVKTDVPIWMIAILVGSSILVIERIFDLITN